MIVVRLLVVLLLIAVAALGLAWVLTGRRRYLDTMKKLLRIVLWAAVLVALLFIGERVLLL